MAGNTNSMSVCAGNRLNLAAVMVTFTLIATFQTAIHHNDFYFSSCVFKMLLGETTNQSPSGFKMEEEKHGQSFGQTVQRLSIQNFATQKTVIDMAAATTL